MKRLATALILASSMFMFGCSGDDSSSSGGDTQSSEVAENCPGCGKALVDGECAA